MTQVNYYDGEFFLPKQNDSIQRDEAYKNIILRFAVDNNIISKESFEKQHVRKLFSITTIKEGKKYTFTVGEKNPFAGGIILAIISGIKFYAVIYYDLSYKSINYSMVGFGYSSDIIYFR